MSNMLVSTKGGLAEALQLAQSGRHQAGGAFRQPTVDNPEAAREMKDLLRGVLQAHERQKRGRDDGKPGVSQRRQRAEYDR